jgi:hypothetical protein
MTQDGSDEGRKPMKTESRIVRALTAGIVASALLLGVQATPTVWAEQTAQTPQFRIDPSRSGVRTGILTQAKGAMVQIDSTNYILAAGVLVENKHGQPWPLDSLTWNNVEFNVQYWLGTGAADRQITQLILHFPE